MATNRVCDVCKDPTKQPVSVVRLAIEITDSVDDSPTGHVNEIDSCETCWPKALKGLSDGVTSTILKAVPKHRKVKHAGAEIAALMKELHDAVITRDDLKPDSPNYAKAHALVTKFNEALAAKEEERTQLLKQE